MRRSAAARSAGATATGLLLLVLVAGSFAWACTAGAETLALSPHAGAPGQEVIVMGEGWTPGRIEVFLETASGNVLLGTSSVPTTGSNGRVPGGSFRAKVTIPAGTGPGNYPIKVSSDGTFSKVASAEFTVLASAAQPVNNPVTAPVPNPQPVTAAPAAEPAMEQDAPVEADPPAVVAASPAPVEARVEAAGVPPMVAQAAAPPAAATAPLTSELVESVYLKPVAEKPGPSGMDVRLLVGACLLVAAGIALLAGLTGATRGR